MDQPTNIASKRFSAIPIPRSSKLPLPGKQPSETQNQYARPASTLGHASTNGFSQDTPNAQPSRVRGSVSSAVPQAAGQSKATALNGARRTTHVQQPLTDRREVLEPQVASNGATYRSGLTDEAHFKRPQRAARISPKAEQVPFAGDSSGGSENDGATSPSAGSLSPIKPVKKSRPSLSDRTVESLSQIPTSPVTDRRRSSFFAPQSPMTPQRPPSALSGGTTGPIRLNHGSIRGPALPRPASPVKRPNSHGTPVPVRRNTAGSSMHKATPSAANARSSTPRPASPSKISQPKPPVPVRDGDGRNVKSKSVSTVPPANRSERVRSLESTKPRPPSPAKRHPRPDAPLKDTRSEEVANSTKKATSSASLRQQIAQAKAAARSTIDGKISGNSAQTPNSGFADTDDTFNQKPKDGKDDLRRRIDAARRDGRLNIAAMSFSKLPGEVLQMYGAEAMEASTVPWSECVDLVRLNAADNDLVELGDEAFPDTSADSLLASEDAKGNQFGGLDNLDLHGNKLTRLPVGLRQLTRLTSLNLARNSLDNLAFDVITQIPTLCDLNLAHNNLSQELPESINRLTLLETLDFSSNRLVTLPAKLRELSRLKSLNLSRNRLTSIPFDQLSGLPRLTDLAASSNALTGALFPSSVTTMPYLRTLDVSGNAIASLNFSRSLVLPAIVRLDVSRNRLGMFPSIEDWTCLTTLLADENALSELPQGMTSLKTKLRVASLERNSLRDVDEGVGEMAALEVLNLGGNPLRDRRLMTMGADGIKGEMERRKQLAKEVSGEATQPTM